MTRREERIAAQFSREFHARGDHQYSGAEIYQWLKRQEGEHIAGNEGIAACMRLNAKLRDERDEALRVRDLAREEIVFARQNESASNRERDAVAILLRAKTNNADWAKYPDSLREAVESEYAKLRAGLAALEAENADFRRACPDCGGSCVEYSGVCHCGQSVDGHSLYDNHSITEMTRPCETCNGKQRATLRDIALALGLPADAEPDAVLAAVQAFALIEEKCLCIVPPNQETTDWSVYAHFDGEFGYDNEIGAGATLIEALEIAAAAIADTEGVQ